MGIANLRRAVFIALAIVWPTQASHAASCLSYSDTVDLEGRLVVREFPGPPNYENTATGDRAESAYLLELPQPICVRTATKDAIAEDLDDVSVVHLVPGHADLAMLQARTGQTVKMVGHLMRAHTGHHHAPLLLLVDLRLKPE